MKIEDTHTNQPAADDAALAQALAGINSPDQSAASADNGLRFEESPLPIAEPSSNFSVTPVATDEAPALPPFPGFSDQTPAAPANDAGALTPLSTEPLAPVAPTTPMVAPSASPVAAGPLDSLKQEALSQLRPLVDKLSLPADEKFDTLLLIIRSTDDQTLLDAAYQAAKNIEDETRRAQALLDVIKEIDFFSNQPK